MRPARFTFPFPYAFKKGFASQVVTGFAIGVELSLDDHLGGDAGMVRTGLPQGVVSGHAVIANQRVHDGVLEGMSHVQAARHVWWRDHDAVGVART